MTKVGRIEGMEAIAEHLGVSVRKVYYLAKDMRKKKVLVPEEAGGSRDGRYVKVNFTYAF